MIIDVPDEPFRTCISPGAAFWRRSRFELRFEARLRLEEDFSAVACGWLTSTLS